MAKRKRKKKEHGFSVTAFRIVQEATGQSEPAEIKIQAAKTKDFDAKELVRRGGQKGGKARVEKLSPEQCREIAKVAASVRWRKKD